MHSSSWILRTWGLEVGKVSVSSPGLGLRADGGDIERYEGENAPIFLILWFLLY